MTDSNAVVTECDLPEAPEKVWQALTKPELLARWLPEANDCEMLAAEPNRLLRYRWRAGEEDRDESGRELDSVVTFELTRTPSGGTHLRVDHRVLVAAPVISLFRARTEPTACACGTSMLALRKAA
jgi:uncharacterized protein YndB with AHSA1/START domain